MTKPPHSANVSEILTLFALQTDARYFQGVSEESPSYRERFSYREPDFGALEAAGDAAACVVRSGTDTPEGWQRRDFGSYCVLWWEG